MANLWAFGDSWVFGDGVNSNETFVSYLADDFKLSCVNLGSSGMSNSGILSTLKRNLPFISKEDFILVCWTSPHRDEYSHSYNKKRLSEGKNYALTLFPQQIRLVESLLSGYNLIMTQAFNPIFGYDYVVDDSYTPTSFIEWGKPNNTLVDIITFNWCEDNRNNYFMSKTPIGLQHDGFFSQDRKHPSPIGHRLIADEISKYINTEILKLKKQKVKSNISNPENRKLLWAKNELI